MVITRARTVITLAMLDRAPTINRHFDGPPPVVSSVIFNFSIRKHVPSGTIMTSVQEVPPLPRRRLFYFVASDAQQAAPPASFRFAAPRAWPPLAGAGSGAAP